MNHLARIRVAAQQFRPVTLAVSTPGQETAYHRGTIIGYWTGNTTGVSGKTPGQDFFVNLRTHDGTVVEAHGHQITEVSYQTPEVQ